MTTYVFTKTSGEILLIKGYTTEKCIINQALKLAKKNDCQIKVYVLSSHVIDDMIGTVPTYYADDNMVVSSETGDVIYNKDTYYKGWFDENADYYEFANDDYLPAEEYDIEIGGDFDYD